MNLEEEKIFKIISNILYDNYYGYAHRFYERVLKNGIPHAEYPYDTYEIIFSAYGEDFLSFRYLFINLLKILDLSDNQKKILKKRFIAHERLKRLKYKKEIDEL